jgi:dienelactone hydrolase
MTMRMGRQSCACGGDPARGAVACPHGRTDGAFGLQRRAVLAALLSAPGWPYAAAAAADDPPFDVTEMDWVDAARQRAVPVRLYLPRDATVERPVPLVVFSHGIGGSRRGYTYLGRHWASHGYASLHLQHVGSDRSLWSRVSLAEALDRVRGALQESEAVARAHDLQFALDRLLASEFGPRIDTGRIVAAGHSYGAMTTLLAAGARVERDGRAVDLGDARIKAAIVISAPPFYGEPRPQKILGSVTVPSLHITATEDLIAIPGYFSGTGDRLAVFDAIGSARKLLAVFEGGSHSMFTDRPTTGGADLNPKVKTATKELALAFLQSVLANDHVALDAWPQRFSGLVARFVAAAR